MHGLEQQQWASQGSGMVGEYDYKPYQNCSRLYSVYKVSGFIYFQLHHQEGQQTAKPNTIPVYSNPVCQVLKLFNLCQLWAD